MMYATEEDIYNALNDVEFDDKLTLELILISLEHYGLLCVVDPLEVMKNLNGCRVYAHVDDMNRAVDDAIMATGKWL